TLNEATKILNESSIGQEKYAVVCVGTANPLKTLHYTNLDKIITGLTTETQLRVIVVAGSRDRLPSIPKSDWVYLVQDAELPVVAELIRRASVVFGGDTGLVQLSAAMGINTVSYWGPTTPTNSI